MNVHTFLDSVLVERWVLRAYLADGTQHKITEAEQLQLDE